MRPKYRQNTPLAPIALIGPGFRGLNTELSSTIGLVDQTWALALQNAVFDDKGRLGLRKGYTVLTTVPMTSAPTVRAVHEYVRDDGSSSLVAASDAKLWASTDNGSTWTDVTGSLTFTGGRVKFVNFQDKVYACNPGSRVWVYTGSGNFTEIATSPVTSGVILAAYGRLWAVEDATSSVAYSALLDGSDWTGTDTGAIDASKVWTVGTDTIVGIAAFGAAMIFFGKRHILVYVDGAGSEVGILPDNMYVTDTIEGTGLVARDAIVAIGEGDLWFLGPLGIQSLSRVIQEKNNPLVDISRNVRSLVRSLITAHTGSDDEIQAVYSAENQFALFLFPASQRVLCVDTRIAMEDGTYRFSEWRSLPYHCITRGPVTKTIYFGLAGGEVAYYNAYRDDSTGTPGTYNLIFSCPWLDFGPEVHNRLKMFKEVHVRLYGRETITGTLRWGVDFKPLDYSQAFTSDYTAEGGEWGVGEWGESEFGTGSRLRLSRIGVGQEGQYAQFYLSLEPTDVADQISLQEIVIYAKVGTYV